MESLATRRPRREARRGERIAVWGFLNLQQLHFYFSRREPDSGELDLLPFDELVRGLHPLPDRHSRIPAL